VATFGNETGLARQRSRSTSPAAGSKSGSSTRQQSSSPALEAKEPRTLEVFDDLGIIDDVLTHGSVPPISHANRGGKSVGEL
jgi:hypothetical protein